MRRNGMETFYDFLWRVYRPVLPEPAVPDGAMGGAMGAGTLALGGLRDFHSDFTVGI